ncbi:hypothetical protein [uncultured Dysgonomonas sp.]|uniref:Phosphate-selective porin O and P n=1 Tax=uncultured Dysgonomonas sp. TaxID=206096 RepID=A0A212JW16_9BACT|nr:hypothetical protein [uncultured Dysgonomonas sp.]SBW03582.1 conserved exported hypothetical protein [uncultured Dysgonomonas sp.]
MKTQITLLMLLSILFCNSILAQQEVVPEKSDTVTADTPPEWNYNKYRFGGYGEILFQQMDYGPDRYKDPAGAPSDKRSYISIPRAVFSFEYKFRPDIIFSTELEIEYGGTGSAMELEYEEGGEYETEIEKGGEIELEQFHITKRFSNAFNIRVGHMIVPVGMTNAHHEPIFFFGTTRPEGESTILPCTWHETGISVLGYFSGFRYELMLVNGLDPNGFSSANWIQGGRQSIFETSTMTNPAVAGRVEYKGIKNLRLSASGYYGNTAKNASKPQKMTGIKAPVSIISADAQYLSKNLAVRGNLVYGNLGASKRVSQINKSVSKNTGFSRTPVAKNAVTYSIEAGYNILSFFKTKERLMPFVRYEYYNSAENVEEGMAEMPINKRNVFTFGVNYNLLPNMVLKADYSNRRLDGGNYNDENTFGLALVYTGWFFKK